MLLLSAPNAEHLIGTYRMGQCTKVLGHIQVSSPEEKKHLSTFLSLLLIIFFP
jgi:hypothetical protein